MPGIGELIILAFIFLVAFVVPAVAALLMMRHERRKGRGPRVPPNSAAHAAWLQQQLDQTLAQLEEGTPEARLAAIHALERLAYDYPAHRPMAFSALRRYLSTHRDDLPGSERTQDVETAKRALERIQSWM